MKALFTFLLLLTITFLQAQPGSLDKTYGNGGIVLTPAPKMAGTVYASAIQADDKVIIAGSFVDTINNFGEALLLQRYNTDGTPDTSFGNEGIVPSHFDSPYLESWGFSWNAVAVQPDGYILAATSVYKEDNRVDPPFNASGDIAIARFKPDGSPDSSFDKEGVVFTDFGKNETIKAMIVQKDGKIVLTGKITSSLYADGPVLTVRYNPDGTLDKTFNGTGYIEYITSTTTGLSLIVQQDNKILVGGTYVEGDNRFLLLRYLPNGTLDNTFGINGKVTTTFSETIYTQVNSLAVLENGNIIAGGMAADEPYTESMTVARYLPDGTIDKSFGKEGKTFVSFGNDTSSNVIRLFIKPDGKILLAGTSGGYLSTPDENFALAQLLSNGTIDSSFGSNGKVSTDLNNQFFDDATDAVMQKDGKVVITGSSYIYYPVAKFNYALARYNTEYIEAQRSVIAKIKRFLHNHGIGWKGDNSNVSYYSVEKSSGTASFRTVARVSRNNTQNYSYIIPSSSNNTTSSTEYYRIREVSTTGGSTFSNIVAVSSLSSPTIYPNPVKGILTINNLDANSTSKITIADLSGTVWMTTIARQQSTVKYDVSKLKPGTYVLTVTNGNVTNALKFVKE